jgi:hypothetical protein
MDQEYLLKKIMFVKDILNLWVYLVKDLENQKKKKKFLKTL